MNEDSCPRCDKPLHAEARWSVPVHACPACGGLWLKESELVPYLHHATRRDGAYSSAPIATRFPLPCPACRGLRLQAYVVRAVEAYRCEHCRGTWLDLIQARKLRLQPPMISTTGTYSESALDPVISVSKSTGDLVLIAPDVLEGIFEFLSLFR